jgi:hypothetical protein
MGYEEGKWYKKTLTYTGYTGSGSCTQIYFMDEDYKELRWSTDGRSKVIPTLRLKQKAVYKFKVTIMYPGRICIGYVKLVK